MDVHTVLPAAAYFAVAQVAQAVRPGEAVNLPAEHGTQSAELSCPPATVVAPAFPAGHFWHPSESPGAANSPATHAVHR